MPLCISVEFESVFLSYGRWWCSEIWSLTGRPHTYRTLNTTIPPSCCSIPVSSCPCVPALQKPCTALRWGPPSPAGCDPGWAAVGAGICPLCWATYFLWFSAALPDCRGSCGSHGASPAGLGPRSCGSWGSGKRNHKIIAVLLNKIKIQTLIGNTGEKQIFWLERGSDEQLLSGSQTRAGVGWMVHTDDINLTLKSTFLWQ